ncbi:MAG: universal stress protein [Smithellaceae bacterium]|nr:universal stress protein [Smithellaceae bacterium]
MFRKILYPTDFSESAGKALEYVKQLREAGAQEVVVISVIDKRSLDYLGAYKAVNFLQMEKEIENEVRQELLAVKEKLEREGFGVKVRLEKGNPLQEILRAEKEEDVSLIVIGSHGKSNIEEMFLGSVAEKVTRKARKPVLIVKR